MERTKYKFAIAPYGNKNQLASAFEVAYTNAEILKVIPISDL